MNTCARILLVEDEVISAMWLESELEKAGYSVCCRVETGEGAIQAVRDERPDLILMDLHLAGKVDGIEAAKAIRELSDVPVIFVSGYEHSAIVEEYPELTGNYYLIKPLRMQEVREIIGRALQEKR